MGAFFASIKCDRFEPPPQQADVQHLLVPKSTEHTSQLPHPSKKRAVHNHHHHPPTRIVRNGAEKNITIASSCSTGAT